MAPLVNVNGTPYFSFQLLLHILLRSSHVAVEEFCMFWIEVHVKIHFCQLSFLIRWFKFHPPFNSMFAFSKRILQRSLVRLLAHIVSQLLLHHRL